MNTLDTITAIATGTGGAINIERISGPEALTIANRVWSGRVPLGSRREDDRKMLFGKLSTGDTALAVYMPGPASYTGDDVVEIQCHGGNMAAAALLEATVEAGARQAEPGEFTFRAFVNGKMDLMQAEAVAEIISGKNRESFTQAARRLEGNGGRIINSMIERLTAFLAELESRLDFPDDEAGFDFTPPEVLLENVAEIAENLSRTAENFERSRIWREGMRVVLAGIPNSGKSSLLNLLLDCQRAIVTEYAGTTRDIIEESCTIGGIPVVLTDTAGLRETADPVEAMGVNRSRQAAEGAGIILWIADSSAGTDGEGAEPAVGVETDCPVWRIWNKCDLLTAEELARLPQDEVKISALNGQGIDDLHKKFREYAESISACEASEQQFSVNARQAAALQKAAVVLMESLPALSEGRFECAGVLWREAAAILREVTGENADMDLLGMIFDRFCIGK